MITREKSSQLLAKKNRQILMKMRVKENEFKQNNVSVNI